MSTIYAGLPCFDSKYELFHLDLPCRADGSIEPGDIRLPSQPLLHLSDVEKLHNFLTRDLCTPVLDQLAPHLYMIATPSSSHISPLHFQKVKNRRIIITEDPKLHLVWYHDRIFVKPLPAYLLSYNFWESYLCGKTSPLQSERRNIAQAARGLLRSYYFLIQYQSDFRIAQSDELQLVPQSATWQSFCDFISSFGELDDQTVAPRYHYGDLRLSRLNYLVKIFLISYSYQEVNWSYSEYFARFYGPLLFIFGVLSVVLSAMQVCLAVEQLHPRQWASLYSACTWFSIAVLCMLAAVLCWMLGLVILKPLNELAYTIKVQAWKHPSLKITSITGNRSRKPSIARIGV